LRVEVLALREVVAVVLPDDDRAAVPGGGDLGEILIVARIGDQHAVLDPAGEQRRQRENEQQYDRETDPFHHHDSPSNVCRAGGHGPGGAHVRISAPPNPSYKTAAHMPIGKEGGSGRVVRKGAVSH